jgi:ATP-dependent DNA helicase RecG
MTRAQAQKALGLKSQANFRDRYLQPALNTRLIEMTILDKPKSSKQKYALTEKGKALLKK